MPVTRSSLRRFAVILVAVVAAAAVAVAPSPTPARAACSIQVPVRLGSSGDAVRCVQSALVARGFAPGPVDGAFGTMTRSAVIAFQRSRGLYVDGVVGAQTAGALGIWGTASTPVPAPAPGSCAISVAVRLGSSGDAVRCVQSALVARGFAPGPVDGAFGTMTRSAVIAFQRSRGLYVDGVVGAQTAGALGIWGGASTPAPGPSGCQPPTSVPASARQVLVVDALGSAGTADLLVHLDGSWRCARLDMPVRVGRNGVRPLAERRSGDGTTPSGTFPLGSMTAPDGQTFEFFGNGANPGVPGTWRQVRSGDCWGATPGTADYNQLVVRSAATCVGDDEYLPAITGAYSAAALIGANLGPDRSGDDPGEPALAAAILLHRHSYDAAGTSRATSGCVSLAAGNLAFVLTRLTPGEAWFVIR